MDKEAANNNQPDATAPPRVELENASRLRSYSISEDHSLRGIPLSSLSVATPAGKTDVMVQTLTTQSQSNVNDIPSRSSEQTRGNNDLVSVISSVSNNIIAAPSDVDKWCKLCTNPLFWNRFMLFVLSLLLLTLSSCYCVAQLLNVELDLITECEPKEPREIWDHSWLATSKYEPGILNEESEYGYTEDECYTTSKYQINTDKLWNNNWYKVHWELQTNAFCIWFGLMACYCLFITVYIVYTMVGDVVYTARDTLHTKSILYRFYIANQSTTRNKKKESIVLRRIRQIKVVYDRYMSMDTVGWIVMMFVSECIEIILQSNALFLYNGYNIFGGVNSIYLANKSLFIVVFTCIISANCFGSGLLWFCYAIFPRSCGGLFFKLTLFFVDQWSDLFYSIFPLFIILMDDYNKNTRDPEVLLGLLNTDTNLAFIATLFPLFLLCNKCLVLAITSTKKLKDEYYTEWKTIEDLAKCPVSKTAAYQAKLHGFNVSTTSLDKNNGEMYDSNGKLLIHLQSNVSGNNQTSTANKQTVKTLLLCIVSLIYIGYGLFLLIFVNNHMQSSEIYCDSVKESNYFTNGTMLSNLSLTDTELQRLELNPELFLWDQCLFKVYPFTKDNQYKCECRVLVINDWKALDSSQADREIHFNLTQQKILTGMLSNFRMLEKFKTVDSENGFATEYVITSSMYNAQKMKAFEMKNAKLKSMENGISNWKDLEYLKLEDVRVLSYLPNNIHQLRKLKYLSLSTVGLLSFSADICALTELEVLHFQWNTIESIPHCISNLQSVQQLLIDGTLQLSDVPLSIFNLSNLYDLSLFHAQITVESLLLYNVDEDIDLNDTVALNGWFEDHFDWHSNQTTYYLQLNPLCESDLDSLDLYVPNKLRFFLENVAQCEHPCNYHLHGAGLVQFCSPFLMGDGFCDQRCNIPACAFDEGDCVQMCFADPQLQNITNCTWELFTNKVCDEGCWNDYCVGYKHGSKFGNAFTRMGEGVADLLTCPMEHYRYSFSEETQDTCGSGDSIYVQNRDPKVNKTCVTLWIGDGFCDDACRIDDCLDDSGDCDQECTNDPCSMIADIWSTVQSILSANGNPQHNFDHASFCELFVILAPQFIDIDSSLNCSYLVNYFDFNHDKYVNFREIVGFGLQVAHRSNDDQHWHEIDHQYSQVNCSACTEMKYYNAIHEDAQTGNNETIASEVSITTTKHTNTDCSNGLSIKMLAYTCLFVALISC
eukprot:906789_1